MLARCGTRIRAFSTSLMRVRRKHKVAIVLGFYGGKWALLNHIQVVTRECRPTTNEPLSKTS